jgi:uncharacterized protein YdgA (DUF945 family)
MIIKTGVVDSYLWVNPANKNINAHLDIHQIRATQQDQIVSSPEIIYEFGMYPGEGNLELGGDLSIRKLFFNDQELGSIDLKGSINKINTKALSDLISAYYHVNERGELYEAELREKIENLLPTLINSGSSIKLNTLDVHTPSGQFSMNGEMAWNMDDTSIPEELPDLLTSADASLNITISKNFLNSFIDFYATSPLTNAGFNLDDDDIDDATDNIYYNLHMNTLLLDWLVNNGQLRDADESQLIALQENMAPIEEYANAVKTLLWDKSITLVTSYFLYWSYLNIENSVVAFEDMIEDSQQQEKSDLYDQVNQLIKKEYITEDKNNYFVTIKQKQGMIQVNGKQIK